MAATGKIGPPSFLVAGSSGDDAPTKPWASAVRRFHLHQSVRRRLCRAIFCLACLLPTTTLLAWTLSRKLPGHVEQCEARLSELLGMDARIERVAYPQPGVCLYEGLELADPETRQPVARCRWLELAWSGRVLTVRPATVEIDSQRADRLVRLLMRRLQRELPARAATVRLLPTSVTLSGPHDRQTYDDAECLIESTEAGDSATLRFRLAGVDMSEAATVVVARRHGTQARTRVSLDTAGAALPVSLFAVWFDFENFLGRDARFRGSLWIDEDDGGRRGDLTGVLTDVDLESLVSARFPHVLSGRAVVEIDRARIEQGRLVEAAGLLRAERGVLGRSLIEAAVKSLHCLPAREPAETDARPINYRQLLVRFVVDADGLRLGGLTTGPDAGTIVRDDRERPLLGEPARQPLPLVAMVRALVPPSQTQVPATQETAALVPWLPLPPVVPPVTANGSPPRPSARVRLPGK